MKKISKPLTKEQVGLKYGFKSGLEETIQQQLLNNDIDPQYEAIKIPFEFIRHRTYTPDFPITDTIIIETKGRFLTADRVKMLEVKKQHPEFDIRFIFSNSKQRISKTSSTTYGMWCEKNGFKYADKKIPIEWIKEIKNVNKSSTMS